MSFSDYGVIDNPDQGKKKRVLFVCSAGILRSATAAHIYANQFNTRCVGSEKYALIRVSENLLAWAHEVVFLSKDNMASTLNYLPNAIFYKEKFKVLDISDDYEYMSKALINRLDVIYQKVNP